MREAFDSYAQTHRYFQQTKQATMISSDHSADERRQFLRSAFRAPVHVTVAGRHHAAQLIDVSLKGALVDRTDAWPVQSGQKCHLRLQLAPQVVIVMAATVAHVDGMHVGLHCDSIDLDSIMHLRNLVEFNADDPALLDRDLAKLVSRK